MLFRSRPQPSATKHNHSPGAIATTWAIPVLRLPIGMYLHWHGQVSPKIAWWVGRVGHISPCLKRHPPNIQPSISSYHRCTTASDVPPASDRHRCEAYALYQYPISRDGALLTAYSLRYLLRRSSSSSCCCCHSYLLQLPALLLHCCTAASTACCRCCWCCLHCNCSAAPPVHRWMTIDGGRGYVRALPALPCMGGGSFSIFLFFIIFFCFLSLFFISSVFYFF